MTDLTPAFGDREADFPLLGGWDAPGEMRGAICLPQDAGGRLLLQLREDRPGVAWPGLWACFGGMVEPGESLRGAMRRELHEETGIDLPQSAFRPFARLLADGPRRGRLHVFTLDRPLRREAIRLGEGAGFGFFAPEALERLETPQHIRCVLEAWRAGRPAGPCAEG